MEIRKAARKYRPLKIAIGGLSGSGKTWGSLRLAYGICGDWNKICIIDTENKSADLYSHFGQYSVLALDSHSPASYIEAIKKVTESKMFDVVILDSISHEWAGKDGVLQLVENISQSSTSGNSYTAWNKGTAAHNDFVNAWIQCPLHTIATMRVKDEYVMQTNDKNKVVPKKVGLKAIQRDGLDYEFDVVFRIGLNHKAFVEKNRTEVFKGIEFFDLDEKIGAALNAWSHNTAIEDATSILSSEVYNSNDPKSKTRLNSIFTDAGITDVGTKKQLAPQLEGKSWTECQDVIKEFVP